MIDAILSQIEGENSKYIFGPSSSVMTVYKNFGFNTMDSHGGIWVFRHYKKLSILTLKVGD